MLSHFLERFKVLEVEASYKIGKDIKKEREGGSREPQGIYCFLEPALNMKTCNKLLIFCSRQKLQKEVLKGKSM